MHTAKSQGYISIFKWYLLTIILPLSLFEACSTAPAGGFTAIPAETALFLSYPIPTNTSDAAKNQAVTRAFQGLDSLRQYLPDATCLHSGRMFTCMIGTPSKDNSPLWIFENAPKSLNRQAQNAENQTFRQINLYRAGVWHLALHQGLLIVSPVRAHVEAALNALENPEAACPVFNEKLPQKDGIYYCIQTSALNKFNKQVPTGMMPCLQQTHLLVSHKGDGQWQLESPRVEATTFDPTLYEQLRSGFAFLYRNEAGTDGIKPYFREDMAKWVADWVWVAYPQKSDPGQLSPLLGLKIKPENSDAPRQLLSKLPVLQQNTANSGIIQVGDAAWLPPAMAQALGTNTPFVVIEENYVWVAATAAALERRQEQLLFGENAAQQIADELSGKASLLLDPDQLESVLRNSAATLLFPQRGLIALKPESGFYTALQLDKPAQSNVAPEYLWRVELSAPIRATPGIVHLEHFSSSQPELVLVQAQDNFLHAFDRMGQLLWRRQIGAPILSQLHAVEGVQAGEGALLFNTTESIWKIDAQGRDLEGFPLQLSTPTSMGIHTADFEHKGRPSFFLLNETGKVYGFDNKGLPLPGWSPLAGEQKFSHPPLHIQDIENDLLLLSDKQGQAYGYGKTGNFKGKVATGTSLASSVCVDSLSNTSVLLLQPDNTSGFPLLLLDAKGRQEKINGTAIMPGAKLLSVREKGLVYYGLSAGKQMLVIPAKAQQAYYNINFSGKPDWFFSPDQQHIACILHRKIILYEASTGKIVLGFPITGNIPFYSKSLVFGGIDQYLIAYQ